MASHTKEGWFAVQGAAGAMLLTYVDLSSTWVAGYCVALLLIGFLWDIAEQSP